MLATLFKDERCQQLPTYGILEKMYAGISFTQEYKPTFITWGHEKNSFSDNSLINLYHQ